MQTALPWYVDSVSFSQCFCLAAASFGTELGPHLLMFLVILGNFQTIIHSIRVSSEWRFKWSQSLLSENSHSVIGTRTSKLNISFFLPSNYCTCIMNELDFTIFILYKPVHTCMDIVLLQEGNIKPPASRSLNVPVIARGRGMSQRIRTPTEQRRYVRVHWFLW